MTPPARGLASLLLGAALLFGLVACQPEADTEEERGDDTGDPPVVEVTAVDYAFQAPDSIPSGWITFRMENQGEETHHFLLDRLPDNRTFEEFRNAFIAPADSLDRLHAAGTLDSAAFWRKLERAAPEWAHPQQFPDGGGVGHLAPGRTAETTVKLEPGTYAMVCALSAPSERVHVYLGMVRPITVTGASTGASPPVPDLTLKTSGQALTTQGSFRTGRQTVALEVESIPQVSDSIYSAALARFGEKTNADEVLPWDGYNPAPVEFLGGVHELPAGQTAYVTADLAPGRYAWSVDYGEEPLTKAFTVE